MTFQASVCVFCGARPGQDPEFMQAANNMGSALAKNNWRLVYGAGDVGIMGAVANATQTAGGQTFGVIPQHLVDWEVAKRDLDHLIVTDDMHTRKKLMFTNSDAVVVLPGGAGSLDEFFEVLTWAQLKLHSKPILLVNIQGYWDPLIALVDHVVDQSFADASLKNLFQVCTSVEDTVETLRSSLKTDME